MTMTNDEKEKLSPPEVGPGLGARADELQRLRAVYEAARRVLRFNGVDRDRTIAAIDEMDDAIERVKSLDSGLEDEGA